MKTLCNCCNRSVDNPYRVYDERGKVLMGCVDDSHSGHLVQISESNRWHNRSEARAIRSRSLFRMAEQWRNL